MIKKQNLKQTRNTVWALVTGMALVFAMPALAVIDTQLDFGNTGAKVTELQSFLTQYPSIYPEGLVTGYFGPLTRQAVERFQTEYGIVSSGDPESTGYGRVGPLTMAKINELLGTNGTGGSEPDNSSPIMGPVSIGVTTTSATISWNTDEVAKSRVMYSTAFPFLYSSASSAIDSTFNETSIVNIEGLQPNTTYYYTRESVDLFDNVSWTVPSMTFTTL